jgi:hypothetical protein
MRLVASRGSVEYHFCFIIGIIAAIAVYIYNVTFVYINTTLSPVNLLAKHHIASLDKGGIPTSYKQHF